MVDFWIGKDSNVSITCFNGSINWYAGIIASCQRTVFMNTYSDEAGWQGWIDHHKECVNEMWFAGCDGFVINTPDIIQGDLSAAEEMIEWLGLDWDEDAVKEFVTPEIWHGGES